MYKVCVPSSMDQVKCGAKLKNLVHKDSFSEAVLLCTIGSTTDAKLNAVHPVSQ